MWLGVVVVAGAWWVGSGRVVCAGGAQPAGRGWAVLGRGWGVRMWSLERVAGWVGRGSKEWQVAG